VKRRTLIAASVCAAAAVAIVVLAVVLSKNVVYFRTVSEVKRDATDGRVRLAGEVVAGSVSEADAGGQPAVIFEITDGKATAEVRHAGDTPRLFDENVPVLCEGRWDEERQVFYSDRILIKHGSEYRPPDVDAKEAS
jgi:cytochrome c-type biogenesis protein CcmE